MRRWFGAVLATIVVLGALTAAPAVAQVTIGQTPNSPPSPLYCVNSPFDAIQSSHVSGPGYVVPAPGGALTSWSTFAGEGSGQQLTFKVYRPLGNGEYSVVAVNGPKPLVENQLNTFKVDIPVASGDVIGLEDTNADEVPTGCAVITGNPGDVITSEEGDVPVGGTLLFEIEEPGVLSNISATFLPPPAVAGLSPSTGSIAGGTAVTISGSNLAEVTGVSFGGVPAASFSVGSESQVTAVSPPRAAAGKVDVSVSTVAGTSAAVSGDKFTYEVLASKVSCVVPKLKGKKLKVVRKKLKHAHCTLGKVKGHKSKSAKVRKQSPKPGTVVAEGGKVNVTLAGKHSDGEHRTPGSH